MDLQGTPISGGGDGQKVTTDPRSNIPKQEGIGHVAPDSLAAESSTFQKENLNAEPPGTNAGPGTQVPSADSGPGGVGNASTIIGKTEVQPLRNEGSSTGGSGGGSSGGDGSSGGIGNSTGVIGKTELAPLTSATGGIGHISGSGQTQPDGSSGASAGAGAGASTGTVVGVGPGGSGLGASEGRGGEPGQGGAAPSYITNVVAAPGGAPHGKNITEGGFEGTADTSLPEPGSKDDPARRAVHDIESRNANSAEASGPRDAAISPSGDQFAALDPTRHAPHSGN